MLRLRLSLFILLIFLAGCAPNPFSQQSGEVFSPTIPTNTPQPTETQTPSLPPTAAPTNTLIPATQVPASPQLSWSNLSNFTYQIADFNIQVTLKDGSYSDDKYRVQLVDQVAYGDLNGDGLPDAFVILAINSGGTGTFFYLTPVVDKNGPVQEGSAYLGDRQRIVSVTIDQGKIIIDYYTQGPNDGLCCPSQHQVRTYRLVNGVLAMENEQVLPNETPTTSS